METQAARMTQEIQERLTLAVVEEGAGAQGEAQFLLRAVTEGLAS